MGKWSLPFCGNLQSHASSVIRPWPDDNNNDAGDVPGEEGVNFGSQKECSPRNCKRRWTALSVPGESFPDIYYVWFCHVLLTMVPQSPKSMKYRKREKNPWPFSWEAPKAQLRFCVWNLHTHLKMEIQGDTKQANDERGLLSLFKASSKMLIFSWLLECATLHTF